MKTFALGMFNDGAIHQIRISFLVLHYGVLLVPCSELEKIWTVSEWWCRPDMFFFLESISNHIIICCILAPLQTHLFSKNKPEVRKVTLWFILVLNCSNSTGVSKLTKWPSSSSHWRAASKNSFWVVSKIL